MHPTTTRSIATSRLTPGLVPRAALAALAATLLAAHSVHGAPIVVGDNSFETPVVNLVQDPEDVIPGAPSPWNQTAIGLEISNQAVGVFGNTTPFITNLDGNQAAYILNYQGNGLYQTLSTNYAAGTGYTMTVGLIGGSGTAADDSMDVILFYENGGNMMTLGDTTVTPSQSNDLTDIQYFAVSIPTVAAGAAEVGKPIGVEVVVSGGNEGGFWDVDNVQLVPEPGTMGLLAFGLGALGWRRRRVAC